MYGREELETFISCELYNQKTDRFGVGEVVRKDEADKVMDAMEARIKELESQLPKWISVNDRLPESDAIQYLVYDETTKKYGKSFFSLILKSFQFDVTHWQPLPPPPTTEDSLDVVKEK